MPRDSSLGTGDHILSGCIYGAGWSDTSNVYPRVSGKGGIERGNRGGVLLGPLVTSIGNLGVE